MKSKHDSINIDLVTGEETFYKAGSKHETPEETAAHQAFYDRLREQEAAEKEAREKAAHFRKWWDELGSYVLIRIKRIPAPEELSAANLGRLFYLSTFCDYDNRLMYNEQRIMTREDFDEIMNMSESPTRKYIAEMKDQDYLIYKNGAYYISKQFLYRGKKEEKYTEKMKMYVKATRNLYQHLEPRHHQYFGIIIRLLPYVNRRFNILCHNPNETDIDLVQPLRIFDICRIFGRDPKNYDDLMEAITGLIFDLDDSKQSVCSLVNFTVGDSENYRFIVNPRLFYVGQNYNEVLGLCTFFPKKYKRVRSEKRRNSKPLKKKKT